MTSVRKKEENPVDANVDNTSDDNLSLHLSSSDESPKADTLSDDSDITIDEVEIEEEEEQSQNNKTLSLHQAEQQKIAPKTDAECHIMIIHKNVVDDSVEEIVLNSSNSSFDDDSLLLIEDDEGKEMMSVQPSPSPQRPPQNQQTPAIRREEGGTKKAKSISPDSLDGFLSVNEEVTDPLDLILNAENIVNHILPEDKKEANKDPSPQHRDSSSLMEKFLSLSPLLSDGGKQLGDGSERKEATSSVRGVTTNQQEVSHSVDDKIHPSSQKSAGGTPLAEHGVTPKASQSVSMARDSFQTVVSYNHNGDEGQSSPLIFSPFLSPPVAASNKDTKWNASPMTTKISAGEVKIDHSSLSFLDQQENPQLSTADSLSPFFDSVLIEVKEETNGEKEPAVDVDMHLDPELLLDSILGEGKEEIVAPSLQTPPPVVEIFNNKVNDGGNESRRDEDEEEENSEKDDDNDDGFDTYLYWDYDNLRIPSSKLTRFYLSLIDFLQQRNYVSSDGAVRVRAKAYISEASWSSSSSSSIGNSFYEYGGSDIATNMGKLQISVILCGKKKEQADRDLSRQLRSDVKWIVERTRELKKKKITKSNRKAVQPFSTPPPATSPLGKNSTGSNNGGNSQIITSPGKEEMEEKNPAPRVAAKIVLLTSDQDFIPDIQELHTDRNTKGIPLCLIHNAIPSSEHEHRLKLFVKDCFSVQEIYLYQQLQQNATSSSPLPPQQQNKNYAFSSLPKNRLVVDNISSSCSINSIHLKSTPSKGTPQKQSMPLFNPMDLQQWSAPPRRKNDEDLQVDVGVPFFLDPNHELSQFKNKKVTSSALSTPPPSSRRQQADGVQGSSTKKGKSVVEEGGISSSFSTTTPMKQKLTPPKTRNKEEDEVSTAKWKYTWPQLPVDIYMYQICTLTEIGEIQGEFLRQQILAHFGINIGPPARLNGKKAPDGTKGGQGLIFCVPQEYSEQICRLFDRCFLFEEKGVWMQTPAGTSLQGDKTVSKFLLDLRTKKKAAKEQRDEVVWNELRNCPVNLCNVQLHMSGWEQEKERARHQEQRQMMEPMEGPAGQTEGPSRSNEEVVALCQQLGARAPVHKELLKYRFLKFVSNQDILNHTYSLSVVEGGISSSFSTTSTTTPMKQKLTPPKTRNKEEDEEETRSDVGAAKEEEEGKGLNNTTSVLKWFGATSSSSTQLSALQLSSHLPSENNNKNDDHHISNETQTGGRSSTLRPAQPSVASVVTPIHTVRSENCDGEKNANEKIGSSTKTPAHPVKCKKLYCEICDVYAPNAFSLEQHLQSNKHQLRCKNSQGLNLFCVICKVMTPNEFSLREHLNSWKHLRNEEERKEKELRDAQRKLQERKPPPAYEASQSSTSLSTAPETSSPPVQSWTTSGIPTSNSQQPAGHGRVCICALCSQHRWQRQWGNTNEDYYRTAHEKIEKSWATYDLISQHEYEEKAKEKEKEGEVGKASLLTTDANTDEDKNNKNEQAEQMMKEGKSERGREGGAEEMNPINNSTANKVIIMASSGSSKTSSSSSSSGMESDWYQDSADEFYERMMRQEGKDERGEGEEDRNIAMEENEQRDESIHEPWDPVRDSITAQEQAEFGPFRPPSSYQERTMLNKKQVADFAIMVMRALEYKGEISPTFQIVAAKLKRVHPYFKTLSFSALIRRVVQTCSSTIDDDDDDDDDEKDTHGDQDRREGKQKNADGTIKSAESSQNTVREKNNDQEQLFMVDGSCYPYCRIAFLRNKKQVDDNAVKITIGKKQKESVSHHGVGVEEDEDQKEEGRLGVRHGIQDSSKREGEREEQISSAVGVTTEKLSKKTKKKAELKLPHPCTMAPSDYWQKLMFAQATTTTTSMTSAIGEEEPFLFAPNMPLLLRFFYDVIVKEGKGPKPKGSGKKNNNKVDHKQASSCTPSRENVGPFREREEEETFRVDRQKVYDQLYWRIKNSEKRCTTFDDRLARKMTALVLRIGLDARVGFATKLTTGKMKNKKDRKQEENSTLNVTSSQPPHKVEIIYIMSPSQGKEKLQLLQKQYQLWNGEERGVMLPKAVIEEWLKHEPPSTRQPSSSIQKSVVTGKLAGAASGGFCGACLHPQCSYISRQRKTLVLHMRLQCPFGGYTPSEEEAQEKEVQGEEMVTEKWDVLSRAKAQRLLQEAAAIDTPQKEMKKKEKKDIDISTGKEEAQAPPDTSETPLPPTAKGNDEMTLINFLTPHVVQCLEDEEEKQKEKRKGEEGKSSSSDGGVAIFDLYHRLYPPELYFDPEIPTAQRLRLLERCCEINSPALLHKSGTGIFATVQKRQQTEEGNTSPPAVHFIEKLAQEWKLLRCASSATWSPCATVESNNNFLPSRNVHEQITDIFTRGAASASSIPSPYSISSPNLCSTIHPNNTIIDTTATMASDDLFILPSSCLSGDPLLDHVLQRWSTYCWNEHEQNGVQYITYLELCPFLYTQEEREKVEEILYYAVHGRRKQHEQQQQVGEMPSAARNTEAQDQEGLTTTCSSSGSTATEGFLLQYPGFTFAHRQWVVGAPAVALQKQKRGCFSNQTQDEKEKGEQDSCLSKQNFDSPLVSPIDHHHQSHERNPSSCNLHVMPHEEEEEKEGKALQGNKFANAMAEAQERAALRRGSQKRNDDEDEQKRQTKREDQNNIENLLFVGNMPGKEEEETPLKLLMANWEKNKSIKSSTSYPQPQQTTSSMNVEKQKDEEGGKKDQEKRIVPVVVVTTPQKQILKPPPRVVGSTCHEEEEAVFSRPLSTVTASSVVIPSGNPQDEVEILRQQKPTLPRPHTTTSSSAPPSISLLSHAQMCNHHQLSPTLEEQEEARKRRSGEGEKKVERKTTGSSRKSGQGRGGGKVMVEKPTLFLMGLKPPPPSPQEGALHHSLTTSASTTTNITSATVVLKNSVAALSKDTLLSIPLDDGSPTNKNTTKKEE